MSVVKESGNPSEAAGLFRSQKFFARVRTAAIMGISALVAIHCTLEWPLYLVMGFIVVLGAIELKILFGNPPAIVTFILIVGLVAGQLALQWSLPLPVMSMVLLCLGAGAVFLRGASQKPLMTDSLATAWLAAPIAAALWLHQSSLDPTRLFSPNLLLILALPIWLGDTAAYFVGKAFGKHPLAPSISPNKTWEGSLANFAACVVTAWVIGSVFALPLAASLGVGVIIGVVGQLGDLLQSHLKRASQLKDSGGVLPGHGGVLDRLDSFLLSSVPAALLLWALVPDLFHVKH